MAKQRYIVRLLEREVCNDILTCRFARPPEFAFSAGQYLSLRLPMGGGPQSRTLTIASAPADSYIEIATRLSDSAFKRALQEIALSSEVEISGPMGTFGLPDHSGRILMLVGGIGITPIRSILRDARQSGRKVGGTLIYGNRSFECIPYRAELEELSGGQLVLVHVLERPPERWTGEVGLITAELVSRYEPQDRIGIAVLTGPPLMVAAMEAVLDALDIPSSARVIERFGPPV